MDNPDYGMQVQTYTLQGYGRMLGDRRRADAYRAAIRAATSPESVVLEIGTGPGVFALMAARFGAKTVYGIDPDISIALAKQAAAKSGLAGRIQFIRQLSTEVTLPEKATVVVSDLRGVLPFFQSGLIALADARRRLAARDALWIPSRDQIHAALVSSDRLYDSWVGPWEYFSVDGDLDHVRLKAVNGLYRADLRPDEVASRPELLWTIDYGTQTAMDYHATRKLVSLRDCRIHGLALWFDSTLSAAASFSNLPGKTPLVYGQGCFPFERPISAAAGDALQIHIAANLVNGDYMWTWSVESRTATFKHSTIAGTLVDLDSLHSDRFAEIPVLTESGRRALNFLNSVDGRRDLRQILDAVLPSTQQMPEYQRLGTGMELAQRYCRLGRQS